MTPVLEIPNAEKIVADYLREQTGARIVARTPSGETGGTDTSWVRLTMLAATDNGGVEHLIQYLIQLDCYAGKDAPGETHGVPEAMGLATEIRAAMKNMREESFDDVVVNEVRFTGMARIPDQDFNVNRERVVLSALVWMHQ